MSVTISKEDAAKAFEAWENDYRANPEGFFTPEEIAQQEVASLSESRAITFFAFLRDACGISI